jgi:diguanylate cyclase (GGDEF)-like protein
MGVMHDITDLVVTNQRFGEAAALLEEQAAQLRVIATTDSPTGCLKRRALFSDAQARLAPTGTDSAALMLDLDHFKLVNDHRHHGAGDAALEHFVECTRSTLRDSDFLVRIGGETFAALLVGVDLPTAEAIAERICAKLRATPLIFDGQPIAMTVRTGIKHTAGAVDSSIAERLRKADSALDDAKVSGRDRFFSVV